MRMRLTDLGELFLRIRARGIGMQRDQELLLLAGYHWTPIRVMTGGSQSDDLLTHGVLVLLAIADRGDVNVALMIRAAALAWCRSD